MLGRSTSLSQAGQDQWVFGEVFNEMRAGYFVDIGAHDGWTISNTYLLEWRYGWSGLCIEANPRSFEKLVRTRRATCLNLCIDRKPGTVSFAVRDVLGGIIDPALDNHGQPGVEAIQLETVPLNVVLREHGAPAVMDYLSIDVEGAEDRVLDSLDFGRYRFNCITIERPSDALRTILAAHAYVLVKEVPSLDCFYVHRDFIDAYRRNVFAWHAKRRIAWRWQ